MFVDPRNSMKSLRWHLVHNLIAHPLLCLPRRFKWPARFHDWTAHRAYYFTPGIPLVNTTITTSRDAKGVTVSC
jgi:hypothetical protein